MPKESRSVPPVPVSQYPFEMYAFGELYAENGKYMKRRGPRTTIKQHQVNSLVLKGCSICGNRIFVNKRISYSADASDFGAFVPEF
jgi:hypothetical protein